MIKERVTQPVVKWGLENYGILPYCWSHWTEFYPALTQLEEKYKGKLQGLRMKYGLVVHDMEHERARAQKWEQVVEQWARGEGEEVSLDALPPAESVEVVEIMRLD